MFCCCENSELYQHLDNISVFMFSLLTSLLFFSSSPSSTPYSSSSPRLPITGESCSSEGKIIFPFYKQINRCKKNRRSRFLRPVPAELRLNTYVCLSVIIYRQTVYDCVWFLQQAGSEGELSQAGSGSTMASFVTQGEANRAGPVPQLRPSREEEVRNCDHADGQAFSRDVYRLSTSSSVHRLWLLWLSSSMIFLFFFKYRKHPLNPNLFFSILLPLRRRRTKRS